MVGEHGSAELAQLLALVRRSDELLQQHHKDIARSGQRMYEEVFFHLLNALHARCGTDNNEPVVCRPQETLDCFLRTRMDVLVLGAVVVSRAGD